MKPFPLLLLATFFSVRTLAQSTSIEVARIKFPAGQEEFELSSAASGFQTITVTASASDVLWVSPDASQKFAAGHLALRIPLAAGEVIVPAKPQATNDGATVFSFAKIIAPTSPVPSTAITTIPAVSTPVTSPAPVAIAPAVVTTPLAAPPRIAPATSTVTSTIVPVTPDNPSLAAAVQQLLPGPVKLDPLAKADFTIPESPGAAVLDQTVQIVRPSSPRETMTSLLSNFDPSGALKTGFSIAITPYTLLRGKPVTLRDYDEKDWVRFMTNLQVSVAAKTGPAPAAGSTTGSPALFGVGLSAVLFDNSDPRRDRAMLNKLKNLFPTAWGTQDDADAIARGGAFVVPPVSQSKLDAYREITAAARRARWNAAAMGFGYAVRLKSASGQIDRAHGDGGGAWLNASAPGFGALQDNSQFLFTGSYRYHDTFTRDGVSGLEDTFNLAAQYRVGTAQFNGFGQAVHHWRAPRIGVRTSDTTVEFGLERKLIDGLWLNLSWTNDKSLGGNSAIKTGLRYGFGQAATLGESP
jgi:hypothetical protein